TYCPAKKYIIISDSTVAALYAESVINSLKQIKAECHLYQIAPGETSKSMICAEQIYTWLLANRFHRDDVIVALGGGVVGDLAGFIAATFLRGVRWVQIPTTLMAQVDSSVGGKVGVNHPLAKNSIGAFYQPQLVWIDPLTLKTLPQREIYNGLAEVIKYGLILDAALFVYLEANLKALLALESETVIAHVIETCCRLKSRVVEQDEREGNFRRVLNFGHTVGHALEQITDYSYFRHGEAVAWGMLAAAAISEKKAGLPPEEHRRLVLMIEQLQKPAVPMGITAEQIMQAMQSDKKMTASGLQFVLLERIGKTRIAPVELQLIEEGIQQLLGTN
ncbi:MAG: 3-dehydroquinate synthase, partial [candidate division KSB1 bacterium]|nr:3-dehydroquinate synthase [candidate division KSB1 bacterium]